MRLFRRSRLGASAIEYALLLGLLAVGTIAAISSSGESVNRLFGHIAGTIGGTSELAQGDPVMVCEPPRYEGGSITDIEAASGESVSREVSGFIQPDGPCFDQGDLTYKLSDNAPDWLSLSGTDDADGSVTLIGTSDGTTVDNIQVIASRSNKNNEASVASGNIDLKSSVGNGILAIGINNAFNNKDHEIVIVDSSNMSVKKRFSVPGLALSSFGNIDISNNNSIYVLRDVNGQRNISKYSKDGKLQWKSEGDFSGDFEINENGSVFVYTGSRSNKVDTHGITKITSNGKIMWTKERQNFSSEFEMEGNEFYFGGMGKEDLFISMSDVDVTKTSKYVLSNKTFERKWSIVQNLSRNYIFSGDDCKSDTRELLITSSKYIHTLATCLRQSNNSFEVNIRNGINKINKKTGKVEKAFRFSKGEFGAIANNGGSSGFWVSTDSFDGLNTKINKIIDGNITINLFLDDSKLGGGVGDMEYNKNTKTLYTLSGSAITKFTQDRINQLEKHGENNIPNSIQLKLNNTTKLMVVK